MNTLENSKELLYKLYIEQELSLASIGAMFSVSAASVRYWLLKFGIRTRVSTQSIYEEIKLAEFSDLQKYLLIGSVLGDGTLTKGKDCKNARFSERHCESQLKYATWKRDLLKPFVPGKFQIYEGSNHIISGVECRTQKSYQFNTISHSYLTKLYHKFYLDGKKVVPLDIYEYMNGLSFAVWITDDGSFIYDKKNSIYRLDLHTESFTYKENIFLCQNVLSNFFDCGFRINTRQYTSGEAYYICISGKTNIYKIVEKLRPFIVKDMEFKFNKYL